MCKCFMHNVESKNQNLNHVLIARSLDKIIKELLTNERCQKNQVVVSISSEKS